MLSTVHDALDPDDEAAILQTAADMTAALETDDDEAFEDASVAFAESCEKNGWEPPEG